MQEKSVNNVDVTVERVQTQHVYQSYGAYVVSTHVTAVSPDKTWPYVELTIGKHKHYFYGEELDTFIRVLQAAQAFIAKN